MNELKINPMKLKQFISSIVMLTLLTSFSFANENFDFKIFELEKNQQVKSNSIISPPTIVGVAVANENFSTLVAAVKAADLVETLSGNGPFTVFAPTNAAFGKLPAGTVENLLKPENKSTLTHLLTYHVVAGKFESAQVVKAIQDNGGKFVIPTVNGGKLTASLNNGNVILTDMNGNTSKVVIADVEASNGVIHAIDNVVMPK